MDVETETPAPPQRQEANVQSRILYSKKIKIAANIRHKGHVLDLIAVGGNLFLRRDYFEDGSFIDFYGFEFTEDVYKLLGGEPLSP